MLRLFTNDQTIDFVTLLDAVVSDGVFPSADDAKVYLTGLAETVPSISNVKAYAQIVQEKYLVRQLMGVAKDILEDAGDEQDADLLLENAEQRIYEIRSGRDSSALTPLSSSMVETLTNLHASEFAFWPGDPERTLLGLMQAIPDDPDTMAVIESTPNGYNYFKTLWDGAQKGENGWTPFFSPWYEEPDYRRPVPPGTELTAEEQELAAAYGLDGEQLMWRRWCIRVNCGGNAALFRQEYPGCPEEAFLFSGTPFFDNQKLLLRLAEAPEPVKVGRFTYAEPQEENGKPVDEKWRGDRRGGYIRVWEEPAPGVPYVMGCDTAGDGSDRYVAWIINNVTGEQAAELRFSQNAILFTRQIWCLGRWYNTALIAVETNYNSYVSMTMELWGYPKLYIRERSMDSYTHRLSKKYGFATTSSTRPVILDNLQTLIDERPEVVKSRDALQEMTHFIYNEKRRPEAEAGEHDDYVMAMAITYYCRDQQRRTVQQPAGRRAEWTEDMYEDYRRADAAGRAYLLHKWGNPF